MKFAILVRQDPVGHPTALAFARAVLERGHELVRVFFYSGGVGTGNRLAAAPADQPHMVRAWSDFARDTGVDLVICANAGLLRGVREANLAPGFRISGIGQLIEAAIVADRFITFGA